MRLSSRLDRSSYASLTRDADTAEVMVQDTMVRALRRWDTYRAADASVYTWCCLLMRTSVKNERRRLGKQAKIVQPGARIVDSFDDGEGMQAIASVAAGQDNVVQLKQMLAALEGVRYADELLDVASGGDLSEIAEARGLASRQTVFQRASSARRAVSHKLKSVPGVDIAA